MSVGLIYCVYEFCVDGLNSLWIYAYVEPVPKCFVA